MKTTVENLSYTRLKTAYEIAAKIVELYGDEHFPVFQRLHEEVQQAKKHQHLKQVALFVASGNIIADSKE